MKQNIGIVLQLINVDATQYRLGEHGTARMPTSKAYRIKPGSWFVPPTWKTSSLNLPDANWTEGLGVRASGVGTIGIYQYNSKLF